MQIIEQIEVAAFGRLAWTQDDELSCIMRDQDVVFSGTAAQVAERWHAISDLLESGPAPFEFEQFMDEVVETAEEPLIEDLLSEHEDLEENYVVYNHDGKYNKIKKVVANHATAQKHAEKLGGDHKVASMEYWQDKLAPKTNESVELDEAEEWELKKIHGEYKHLKSLPTADVLKKHKAQSRVSASYSAAEMGGKEGLISDIMRNRHGQKRMDAYHALPKKHKDALSEEVELDETMTDLQKKVAMSKLASRNSARRSRINSSGTHNEKLTQQKDDIAKQKKYNEEVELDEAMKPLPRRHFFKSFGVEGHGIAHVDDHHWKIENGKPVAHTTDAEVVSKWKSELAAKSRMQEAAIDEVLTAKTPVETWIKDFQDSTNPKFEGKSKEKRRKMALAAYYDAQSLNLLPSTRQPSIRMWQEQL